MIALRHVSHRPKIPYRNVKLLRISLIALLVALSSIYPLTWATEDNNDHHPRHRHHHVPITKHRINRSSPGKSTHPQERPILYKCNDTAYRSDWENIMAQLDKELEKFESESLTTSLAQEQLAESLKKMRQELGSKSFQSPASSAENSNKDDILSLWGMSDDIPVTNSWHPHMKLLELSDQNNVDFSLQQRSFHCPQGRTRAVFHWHSFWDKSRTKYPILELSNMSLITNGTLVWNKENGERHIYKKEDYCILEYSNEWAAFEVCLPSPCSDEYPCIRKCCLPSELIDEKTRGCKPTNPAWKPKFYRTAGDTETSMGDSVAAKASVIVGLPNCDNKYMFKDNPKQYIVNDSPKSNFKLLLNGSLVHIEENSKTYIHPKSFCIDGLYYMKKSDERIFQGSEWDQVVIACKPTETARQVQEIRIKVYAILNVISALFLLITDIVYILIWRHQNNIHSWLQFSYATSLLFTFTCFAINQLYSEVLIAIAPWACKVMGSVAHLTYLSAFFWLTSMNFDLWWRFSRPLRSARIQTQEKKRKRFIGFALFSIVIPSLISCIGIALDFKYEGSLSEPPITIPGFGKEKCYFKSKQAQIPYLYFPAGVLLLVDFIFFASTVLHLRKMHTHTELARTQSTSSMEDKKGVRVIAKLFIVMGVLWVFELLSWILQLIFTNSEKQTILILIFTPIDCLNSIQGVFIFCIFICKPNVTKHLYALFKKEDSGKAWNKHSQLPSVSTVQQTVKRNYLGFK